MRAMGGMNQTPFGERVHIAFFGRRNAGKSSLMNAFTGQEFSVVSAEKGTTTDVVYKAMELLPAGPVLLIDTPGLDDAGELGEKRIARARAVMRKADIAIVTADAREALGETERELLDFFEKQGIPCLLVWNKADLLEEVPKDGENTLWVSAKTGWKIHELRERVAALLSERETEGPLIGDLLSEKDTVILVVPVDAGAPKGRLILPQQQVIRGILDAGAFGFVCRDTELEEALGKLACPPKLVVTDSQVFDRVNRILPESVPLTSFSILMARYKGDLALLAKGAAALGRLQDGDRVLADLRRLNGSLNTLPGHLTGTGDAVDDVTGALSGVADAAVSLRANLDNVSGCLRDLQRDIRDLRSGSGNMEDNLNKLGTDLKALQDSLKELEQLLKTLDLQISGGIISEIPEEIQNHIKVQGQKLSDILAQVNGLEAVWAGTAAGAETISYQQFQTAALLASKTVGSAAEAQALLAQIQAVDNAIAQVQSAMPGLTEEQAIQYLISANQLTQGQAAAYAAAKPKLALMEQVYAAVTGGVDRPMDKAGFFTAMLMLSDISKLPPQQQTPENIASVLAKKALYAQTGKALSQLNQDHNMSKITGLLENLERLLAHLGSGGLTGDLSSLIGKTDTTLGHLDGLADVGRDILNQVDELLLEIRELDNTISDHVPGMHDTLRDTRSLVEDMVVTVDDTTGFLTSFRQLARNSGSQLDTGTRESLAGLSASLRKAARSVDTTGDVREAKGKIDEIVEDTWTEYTGKVNNLLLMDAEAPAVSLTSEENPSPSSVQVLIRSQEIKAEAAAQEEEAASPAAETTFWNRVTQMFQDFWSAITGIFHR